jgi:peptide deformylase
MNEKGKRVAFRCGGLLARAVQHETDHLNGILFIDRMDSAIKRSMKPELDELHAATREALEKKKS